MDTRSSVLGRASTKSPSPARPVRESRRGRTISAPQPRWAVCRAVAATMFRVARFSGVIRRANIFSGLTRSKTCLISFWNRIRIRMTRTCHRI